MSFGPASFGCHPTDTGESIWTLDGKPIAFGLTFYPTHFNYEGKVGIAGIATGCETYAIDGDGEKVGRNVREASGGKFVEHEIDGKTVRYYRLNDTLYCGPETVKRVLYYQDTGLGGRIRKIVVDGRWDLDSDHAPC